MIIDVGGVKSAIINELDYGSSKLHSLVLKSDGEFSGLCTKKFNSLIIMPAPPLFVDFLAHYHFTSKNQQPPFYFWVFGPFSTVLWRFWELCLPVSILAGTCCRFLKRLLRLPPTNVSSDHFLMNTPYCPQKSIAGF